jgi:hypothetical protein
MKETIMRSYSFINVLGYLWMPQIKAAQYKALRQYDIDNMTDESGNITRESVDLWLSKNAGDFSSIIDFHADIETNKGNILIAWENEENEYVYGDCMNDEY